MFYAVSFEQHCDSYLLRRTVERAVQIISEAAKALSPEILSEHPQAPWPAIVAVGNILRHEYQRIDDGVLWDIATNHLPKLRPVIMRMLEDTER